MLWMVALSYANLSWFCSLIGGKWRHPERRARIHKIETSSPENKGRSLSALSKQFFLNGHPLLCSKLLSY